MLRIIYFLCLLLGTTQCYAFETWEHRQLGDLAFHIALEIHGDKRGELSYQIPVNGAKKKDKDDNCEEKKRYYVNKEGYYVAKEGYRVDKDGNCVDKDSNHMLIDSREISIKGFFNPVAGKKFDEVLTNQEKSAPGDIENPARNISYGEIVACVDYFLSAEKMLAGRENRIIGGTRFDEETKKAIDNYKHKGKVFPEVVADVAFIYQERCNQGISNLELIRASHVNHSHFQAELIASQRSYHLLAITFKAIENKIFSALIANAISDHYLMDSFAPGHISTMRSRTTDYVANAIHDHDNQEGKDITVNLAWGSQHKAASIENILTMLKNEKDNSGAMQKYFFHCPEKETPACKNDPADSEKINTRLANLNTWLGENLPHGKANIKVKGDDLLWKEGQDKQRLVMLWTMVQSILDVLESSGEETVNNRKIVNFVDSFKNSEWSWLYTEKSKTNGNSEKKDEYADSNSKDRHDTTSRIAAKIGPASYEIMGKEKQGEHFLNPPKSNFIWGGSYGVDIMAFGDSSYRKNITLEWLKPHKISTSRWGQNNVVAFGIQSFRAEGSKGSALSGRYLFIKPEVDVTGSIQLRALRLERDRLSASWRPSLGARVEVGFSSFLTSYIQGNFDYAVQKNGTIRSGWSFGWGIQVISPTCRIPGIKTFAWLDCYGSSNK